MEFRDWKRPKATSAWWLLFFSATLPCVGVFMSVLNGRGLYFPWGRTSFTVGFSIAVIAFLWQYLSREKLAWRSLESKLRKEVFVVEALREELRVLQERVARLEATAEGEPRPPVPAETDASPEKAQDSTSPS
jgi:hypothetical protein